MRLALATTTLTTLCALSSVNSFSPTSHHLSFQKIRRTALNTPPLVNKDVVIYASTLEDTKEEEITKDSDDKEVKPSSPIAKSTTDVSPNDVTNATTTTTAADVVASKDDFTSDVEEKMTLIDIETPSNDTPSLATKAKALTPPTTTSTTDDDSSPLTSSETDLLTQIERESQLTIDSLMDDEACDVDPLTGTAVEELCLDESKLQRVKSKLKNVIAKTLNMVRGGEEKLTEEDTTFIANALDPADTEGLSPGEILELGWEKRGNSSALRRNAEVWKFALQCVFKILKSRKLKTKEGGAESVAYVTAKTDAATFLRDGLLTLGPTFVKLGQVLSTRTDVLPTEWTDVLKTLQDDVPGFSGARAKAIVTKELGKDCDEVFSDFSPEPLAAASLGQVHTATYKGKKVAIKVQRAGLKKLFDVDLKNLKKLAELLDKFDPKTDGADRDWVSIYEESERLLYLEIDYLNEAANAERFAKDFSDTEWVRVPDVLREVSTPRVLTMEFVESFKLTNLRRIDELGLDRELLARRTADAFLRQIIETGYFHCDPHPGNLCVDTSGNLVYYDFGMMDELNPNVRSGFRKFCTALFAGGPTIDQQGLAKNAKMLVDGVEEAGVLARGADRLAVEKLARYFMRTFKDSQLGKKGANIKQTIGNDLQTLTENNVFRFPSTFTFIFRSFASIDGIGKGLDENYDIGKLAQPFVEKFTDVQRGYKTKTQKNLSIFAKATGLNLPDVNTAITSPKKIAYVEETLRSMEEGNLKIRVRSLENEKALERMALTQGRMENLVLTSVLLNIANVVTGRVFTGAAVVGAVVFAMQAVVANGKIKKFDKTQDKFKQTKFEGDDK